MICRSWAIKLGLVGRPVCHCPACGKLQLAGKGFVAPTKLEVDRLAVAAARKMGTDLSLAGVCALLLPAVLLRWIVQGLLLWYVLGALVVEVEWRLL